MRTLVRRAGVRILDHSPMLELLAEPVYCRLDHAIETDQVAMRRGQPNFFLPFDRMAVNPFTERFPITLLAEGTVRGSRWAGPRPTGAPSEPAAHREVVRSVQQQVLPTKLNYLRHAERLTPALSILR